MGKLKFSYCRDVFGSLIKRYEIAITQGHSIAAGGSWLGNSEGDAFEWFWLMNEILHIPYSSYKEKGGSSFRFSFIDWSLKLVRLIKKKQLIKYVERQRFSKILIFFRLCIFFRFKWSNHLNRKKSFKTRKCCARYCPV